MNDPLQKQAERHILKIGIAFQFQSNVELVLEMVGKRELGISLEQACVVFGPLGAGAKVSLVSALLSLSGNCPKLIEAVQTFQRGIGRNALAHGFVTFADPSEEWMIVAREVKSSLKIRTSDLDSHFAEGLHYLVTAVLSAADITDQELHDYGVSILYLKKDS